MRRDTPVTLAQVLKTGRILHFSFTVAPVIYAITGEVMRLVDEKFRSDGYNDLGDAVWLPRIALFGWWLISSFIAHWIVTDERYVDVAGRRSPAVDDAVIATALQAAMILRFALVESVATLGLVLYTFNADRIDLYVFPALAIVNMILLRPTRDRWDAALRNASIQYPGVSSSVS